MNKAMDFAHVVHSALKFERTKSFFRTGSQTPNASADFLRNGDIVSLYSERCFGYVYSFRFVAIK